MRRSVASGRHGAHAGRAARVFHVERGVAGRHAWSATAPAWTVACRCRAVSCRARRVSPCVEVPGDAGRAGGRGTGTGRWRVCSTWNAEGERGRCAEAPPLRRGLAVARGPRGERMRMEARASTCFRIGRTQGGGDAVTRVPRGTRGVSGGVVPGGRGPRVREAVMFNVEGGLSWGRAEQAAPARVGSRCSMRNVEGSLERGAEMSRLRMRVSAHDVPRGTWRAVSQGARMEPPRMDEEVRRGSHGTWREGRPRARMARAAKRQGGPARSTWNLARGLARCLDERASHG
jgi:hypothetical protein